MKTEKSAEFLQKLRALLAEYNASITWTCSPGSDTHGIYDDAMEIDIGADTIFTSERSYICADDLPNE